jgi:restriction system protein
MAKRRRYRKDTFGDILFDIAKPFAALLILGIFGYAYLHPAEVELYGSIATVVLVVGIVLYFVLRKKKHETSLQAWSDEEILYMLKGMSPTQFESKVADMFGRLGYETGVTGGANDGGIDVIARKDGKRYFIQCKKFMTREVTPHDVRDFLGAITNVNNPAEKGYFVTTNGFTLMAEKAAEGNPRIELIDGSQLVQYYKLAYGEAVSGTVFAKPAEPEQPKVCPQCGGVLNIKVAQKGDYAGQQFWGCSNFPKCRYIENIKKDIPIPRPTISEN